MMALAPRAKTSRFHRKTQQNLDKRPCEVVPVGAWVELCPQYDSNAYEAVQAARYEEERLQRLQAEKEAKLAHFRQEVRSRVRELQKLKRQQQLQESFQAVNLQGRVLQRTAPSANQLSQRKDACLYQSTDPHAIGHTRSAGDENEDQSLGGQMVVDWAGNSRRLVQKAKRDLAAKQLAIKAKVSGQGVPGGVWGASFTRDRPATVADSRVDGSREGHQTIPQQHIEGALYDNGSEYSSLPDHADERLHSEAERINQSKRVTFAPGLRGSPHVTDGVKGHGSGDHLGSTDVGGHGDPDHLRSSKVNVYGDLDYLGSTDVKGHGSGDQFRSTFDFRLSDLEEEEGIPSSSNGQTFIDVYGRTSEIRGHGDVCERVKGHLVPEVNPGVVAEEHRRQQGLQFSMFRRLYMDIEREQVREKTRKRTHHKKIQELKKNKEQERLEVEQQTQRVLEPPHNLAESEAETRQRELEESQEIHKLQTRIRQKNKETKRFIRALRAMMKERIDLLGVNPPPLCACGPSVWDANPDTCANNCIFYKNPKAYAKALASVLTVNDTG